MMKKPVACYCVCLGVLSSIPVWFWGQWTQIGGPEGSDIRALLASGTNLFAGTQEGVFLSTNNGISWTAASSGLKDSNVQRLVAVGTNLFAGTFEGNVYVSSNKGGSWTIVRSGLPAMTGIKSSASLFGDFKVSGDNFFVASHGGLFLSTDRGTNWRKIDRADIQIESLEASGNNLFASSNLIGVFLSTDDGASWTAIDAGWPAETWVYFLFASGEYLFAGTGGGEVWRLPLSELESKR